MYAALQKAQRARTAAHASSHRPPSPSSAAKTIPANNSRFFVHCSGLNATSAAISGGRLVDSSVTAFEAVSVTAADGVRLLSATLFTVLAAPPDSPKTRPSGGLQS